MKQSYKFILQNNEKWIDSKLSQDSDFFKKLAKAQNPEYLYIGSSDSRVIAEEIMGVNPGEVFVHRSIANVVNTLDMNSTAVIQYAVEHLKVKHIIVCGNYHCEGIKAAMTPQDFGLLNPWLRNIRDVCRLHHAELNAIEDEGKRYDRLVELNVLEQCINVTKMACVQERYILEEYPIVHGWVFDLRTGRIIDLEIDFEKVLKDIQKIYNLTDSDWVMSRKSKLI
ncbi:carbonic anhydrase [Elizabethkingia anophelis]|uniref:Carbonic anhydrase 2 n=1 Tax=Elizabethkingia anophelis TaxID=1117645 RepID=A0AAU8UWA9_9FLAO|nr:carbonic anhydrase [Elizabethkingia anophelis]AQX02260.1 carbonic anhydrase [Elizabethkingia anophelis]OPB63780.1 carbonic anhydrase [Elizabethkingia anophelis]